MPDFEYTALDAKGEESAGTITANDEAGKTAQSVIYRPDAAGFVDLRRSVRLCPSVASGYRS